MIKFELPVSSVAPYLKLLVGTVESSQVMQILAHVHISIQDQVLVMTTSNTEMEVCVSVPLLEEVGNASFTISAKKLSDITRLMDVNDTMLWVADDNWVYITIARVQYKLATLDAKRFPFLIKESMKEPLFISASNLRNVIDKTVFGVAKQDIRMYLNGLLLDFTPGHLTVVSSDSFRMCVRSFELDGLYNQVLQAVIPKRTALELSKLLATIPEGENVAIAFAENLLSVNYGSWQLTSHLIDAYYPAYRRVAIRDHRAEFVFPTAEVKNSLARMSVCAGDRNRCIQLLVDKDLLTIKSENFDKEEAIEEIPINYSGPQLQSVLNLNYFNEAISVMASETVRFLISNDDLCVMMMPDNDPSAVYMIMTFTV